MSSPTEEEIERLESAVIESDLIIPAVLTLTHLLAAFERQREALVLIRNCGECDCPYATIARAALGGEDDETR